MIVESDTQVVIHAINQWAKSYIQHVVIIREIVELSKWFQSCNFCYVNRLGNQVAHQLARLDWRVDRLTILE